MAKPTTIKEAIKAFEAAQNVVATETDKVLLYGQIPPIEKMDATLSTLKACVHLSLSTNNIEKISSLSGMDNLKILSLGRNLIKKVENLDGVAETLEELWMSYNQVEKLVNIDKLQKLKVLFLSNNKIDSWVEIEKLAALEELEELLLINNPLYVKYADKEDPQKICSTWRVEVLKRLPKLKKLDGVPVDVDEKEAASAGNV